MAPGATRALTSRASARPIVTGMMDLDPNDLVATVTARAARGQEAGGSITASTRGKSAACVPARHEAPLIVWTSGEAEMDVGDI